MPPFAPGSRAVIRDEEWLPLPGGPREVQRTYTAPFARASREDDYRVAWAFFEGSGT